jgi:tetratricopeptide (TPR) repeat protein
MKKLCFMLISMLIGTATLMAQFEPLMDAPAPEEVMLIGPSYNGKTHTPRGHLHILHVFVQFQGDEKENDDWILGQIPVWADDLYYSDLSEFSDTATDLSVSNYYYQNSKFGDTAFYVTGEYLDELIIIPPIANPDSSNESPPHVLNYFDYLVVDSIVSKYPNKDWSVFDKRTNKNYDFSFNNINTQPDSVVDAIVIHYRWFEDPNWCITTGVPNKGSTGGIATVHTLIFKDSIIKELSSPFGNWTLPTGSVFTRFTFQSVRDLFIHEFHHIFFTAGHYGGGNTVVAPKMHLTYLWTMFKAGIQMMDISNAWEKYMLKWFEFKEGYDVNYENSSKDPYILDDFATTNDALRIKIPNSNTYIWLENHQMQSFLDERRTYVTYNDIVLPQPKAGIYAYVVDWHNRESFAAARSNCIKVLNGAGNFKFTRNEEKIKYPLEWNNAVYTFNATEPDPYGGFGHNTYIVDDYDNNNSIKYDEESGKIECEGVYREGLTEPQGSFTYNLFSAETIPLCDTIIYSAFSNPPIINTPALNNFELDYYILHDLRFWINEVNGKYWVSMDYDNEIKESIIFTNKIKIPENSEFKLKDGITVNVSKSESPNKVRALGDEPIAASKLFFDENSSLIIPENSQLIVNDNSNVKIEDGVTIDLQGIIELKDESKMYINGEVDFSNGEIYLHENTEILLAPGSKLKNVKISGPGKLLVYGLNATLNNTIINCVFDYSNNYSISYLSFENHVVFNTNFISNEKVEFSFINNSSVVFNNDLNLGAGSSFVGDLTLNTVEINGDFYSGNISLIKDLPKSNNIGGLKINTNQNFYFTGINTINSSIDIYAEFSNLTVSNNNFSGSLLNLSSFSDQTTGYCVVENNQFQNSNASEAIRINDFNMFSIKNNTIENNQGHGIAVYNSGSVNFPAKRIESNLITNNQKNDTAKGIIIYNSVVDIYKNNINNNDIGIALFHNSIVSVYGQSTWAEDQKIIDNSLYQVYSSRDSWPWKFEYNEIKETNSVTPRVYHDNYRARSLNIENNCWGDNFDTSSDLWPYRAMDYSPIWDCGGPIGDPILLQDPAQVLYTESLQDIADEDYTSAKTKLETIVEEYPNSSYAGDALKTMPVTTTSKSNYDDLINYYQTNSVIQGSEELKLLVGYIIAELKTDEQQFNEALTFYEGIISNPPSDEDYVYALIDAARVYNLAEANGDKAPENFKFKDLLPKSKEDYRKTSRQYVDGLVKIRKNKIENSSETDDFEMNLEDELFNVFPNPVSSVANIIFTAKENTNVTIEIFNVTGKNVYSQTVIGADGVNTHQVSMKDIDKGIYFVRVSVNSQSEVKRIVLE